MSDFQKEILMDQLANSFSALQNGQRRFQYKVTLRYSKMFWSICHILYSEGFLKGFALSSNSRHIIVYLKYFDGKPLLQKIQKISLQGRRVYCEYKNLFTHDSASFRTFRILSTSQGILSEKDAFFFHVGGEVLCEIS
jgi:small subunit ribosomal protein S8